MTIKFDDITSEKTNVIQKVILVSELLIIFYLYNFLFQTVIDLFNYLNICCFSIGL